MDQVKDVRNRVSDAANSAVDKGASYAHQAIDKGSDLTQAVLDTGSKAVKRSEEFIKANPHSTVASGFGLGVLIGGAAVYLLMSRRD